MAKAARSAKPKDQVSLKPMPASLAKKMNQEAMSDDEKNFKPHMMYDPKTGKGYKADKYADHVRMNKMGYTHDDPKTKKKDEALKGDQHKLDHDKDGDIDAADFKGLRNKKKKGEKAEVKPRQEPDTEKGKGDAPMEKTESTRWPVYARIMEKKSHTAGATPPEEMDSKDSPTAKKMKADHKPEVKDNPEASGDDVRKATDSAPAMKARSNDNMKGDKAIVNPVKGAVTK